MLLKSVQMREQQMKTVKLASFSHSWWRHSFREWHWPRAIRGFRVAPARAGSHWLSVNSSDGTLQFFQNGLARFQDIESVKNSPTGNNGLGPRFNFVSCSGCHLQPAVGGTGPHQPQFQVIANGFVSGSTTPYRPFITTIRPDARSAVPVLLDQSVIPIRTPSNGGVEDLFTVSGRSDAELQLAAAQFRPRRGDHT